ncbi:polysaccharide deacetylase family protein [Nonlabens sp.]|uniref:polysaccharide deacetylase family protein n=1 Tax=Nonlabens sp. TaxID=1888209 RepID=UPI0025D9D5C7|nr:polysaccharide deacetylase family protein [Nonlabens sp.]
MGLYPDRIPYWFSKLFSSYFWHGDRQNKRVYLTFDDGPTPEATDFVLRELAKQQFQATFFCIGDQVAKNPEIYDLIQEKGHRVGNHTFHHLNAWTASTDEYLNNVDQCAELVSSNLFRPPYGRITGKLTKGLKEKGYKIILWDVLSGDFDPSRTSGSCLTALKKNTRNGSVIVFHDSEKSFQQLQKILPPYLEFLRENGWASKAISVS